MSIGLPNSRVAGSRALSAIEFRQLMLIAGNFTYAAALLSCLFSQPAGAQRADNWGHAFSMAVAEAPPLSEIASPCYVTGSQPDSVYLTPARVENVEAWGGAQYGWRKLAGEWFADTIAASLSWVNCLADERTVQRVVVQREGRYLRLNVLAPPGLPPDVIRVRSRKGDLAQLIDAELPDGKIALISRDSLAAARTAIARKREAAQRRAAIAERAARRKRMLALGWSQELVDAVLRGTVQIGMSAAMVREAWGEPDRINSTVTASGVSEQWVYGIGEYVYLESGRVTSMQSSR